MKKKMENEEATIVDLSDTDNPLQDAETAAVARAISTVNVANECSVLMTVLCEKLKLDPRQTTHTNFVKEFTDLQSRSLEAQKYLQEKFIVAPVPEKMRKKRMTNV